MTDPMTHAAREARLKEIEAVLKCEPRSLYLTSDTSTRWLLAELSSADQRAEVMAGLLLRAEALWQSKFPAAGLRDHLRKLSGEVAELFEAPDDPDEWADVLLCYLMSAAAKGYSAEDLLRMAGEKMTVCESQEFVQVGDGTYRRVKARTAADHAAKDRTHG